ncbi:hypothetical protein GCM10028805_34680 [Spirosoma harenae]
MRILLVSFLVLFSTSGIAQLRYGNEWIVPEQSYAKISVSENGIYRVSYTELVAAGFTVDAINPQRLQLFHHGRELAIEVIGEADGRFDPGDFIQFYAEKNQGGQDSLVYYHASRANPYQSLFSDETIYFLTVGGRLGKRIQTHPFKTINQDPEPYHLEEQVIAYADQYSFNNSIGLVPAVQQSYFEEGEGWTGKYIVPDTTAKFSVKFKNRVAVNDVSPVFEFQLNGRSPSNHRIWYSLNNNQPIDTIFVEAFNPKKITIKLDESDIQDGAIQLNTQTLPGNPYDWYSMTYLKVVYPQRFLMDGQRNKYFNLRPNVTNQSVVHFDDLGADYLVYAITDQYNSAKIEHQKNQFIIPNTASKQQLFISNEFKKSAKITRVNYAIPDPKAYNYLIVTHNSLAESANQYAEYRSSVAGGSYKPLVIDTKSIYEQFNFGERSPIAIRRFADFMLSGRRDQQLFLLGRGISFPDILKKLETQDLVPTFGYPGSDALLTMGLSDYPEFVQAIPTGRINVTTNQQVLNYLAKVKEAEQSAPDDWQKRILHLNGGHDKAEITYLKSLMEQLRPIAENPYMGAQVKSLSKRTFEEVETVDISKEVNEGVSMISYTGHGSSNTLDFNFGYCSTPTNKIANKGKYPILFFNGYSINNIFHIYDPLSTDWLIAPDKGAIAVLAGSFWSYPASTQMYAKQLYQKLFADTISLALTLGQTQQQVNLALSPQSSDLTLRSDMQQIILQGDPALKIFPLTKPDYVARSLFIQARKPGKSIAEDDSLIINLVVASVGKYIPNQAISVELAKTYSTNEVVRERFSARFNSIRDTIQIPIQKDVSVKKLEILVDSEAKIDELVETNNQISLELTDWQAIQQNSIYPINALPDRLNPVLLVTVDQRTLKNGDYVSANPIIQVDLTDENKLSGSNLINIQTYLKQCGTCPFIDLTPQSGSALSSVSLQATYQLNNLAAGTYELVVKGSDAAGNASGTPYTITFNVADSATPTTWRIYPNPSTDIVQISYTLIGQIAPKSAFLQIVNQLGTTVETHTLTPFVGENTFYWENLRQLPAGLYHANLRVVWGDGREEVMQGKLVKN